MVPLSCRISLQSGLRCYLSRSVNPDLKHFFPTTFVRMESTSTGWMKNLIPGRKKREEEELKAREEEQKAVREEEELNKQAKKVKSLICALK